MRFILKLNPRYNGFQIVLKTQALIEQNKQAILLVLVKCIVLFLSGILLLIKSKTFTKLEENKHLIC